MSIARTDRARTDDVVIARIVKTRGIRGELACDVETDFPSRFDSLDRVLVVLRDGEQRLLDVEHSWFHQRRVIVKFQGYDSMTAAKTLVGGCLVVPDDDEFPLADDQYYERRLIGAAVVTVTGREVGRVARLLRTGGTDLLVIEGNGGREHLIPFADAICTEVDVDSKRITIDPPEGLLDL